MITLSVDECVHRRCRSHPIVSSLNITDAMESALAQSIKLVAVKHAMGIILFFRLLTTAPWLIGHRKFRKQSNVYSATSTERSSTKTVSSTRPRNVVHAPSCTRPPAPQQHVCIWVICFGQVRTKPLRCDGARARSMVAYGCTSLGWQPMVANTFMSTSAWSTP